MKSIGGRLQLWQGIILAAALLAFGLTAHFLQPGAGMRLIIAGLAVFILALMASFLILRRTVRPIGELRETTTRIASGDLSQRLKVSARGDELDQLAESLNVTFARLEALLKQQQRFTSDAAHELRTPVSVILTQSQSTLRGERTTAEYRETLQACERAAKRMRQLIESLLALARLDAGQEKITLVPFNLSQTARECVELVRPLAEERRIKLHADFPATECVGDAQLMSQVITNLLTNAIKYNHEDGEVRLEIRTENNSAILSVADTGQGIASDDLPHVFERFYRADKSRSSAHLGRSSSHAGLGLAICKAIVEAHNGTIRVASKRGAGATFTVRLPAPAH